MPIVNLEHIAESDIATNPDCIFMYADNDTQRGTPHVNSLFRNHVRAFPVILKKRAGIDAESFWSDDEYVIFRNSFLSSISRIKYFLRRKQIVIKIGESFNDDEFNLSMMDKMSSKSYEEYLSTFMELNRQFLPKAISEQEIAGVKDAVQIGL